MPTQVALLRGVNVGGRNAVPMAALRDCFTALGHTDVETYIQSGNVVFTSRAKVMPRSLEQAIERQFGFPVPVVVRTPAQLTAVLDANPFPGADPSKLHVGFLVRRPTPSEVAGVDAARYLPEELTVVGTEIYFLLPNGMGNAKLPPYVGRRLGIATTARNWSTVTKLLELTA